MNAFEYLLRFPWVEPLGKALLHFLWQGALIGAAASGLLRLVQQRSPALRHALAAASLTLCAFCPLGTFLFLAFPWPPAPSLAATALSFSEVAPAGRASFTVGAPTTPPLSSPRMATPVPRPGFRHEDRPPRVVDLLISVPWRTRAIRWAVLSWIVGVLALGGRLGIGWVRVQLWRRGARPVNDADLTRCFRRLADRLGVRASRVRLLVSQAVALPGPIAMGAWRPAVLLPANVLKRLPLNQIEALLAHELAHIRRHDYLWNLLASALEVALFYHPVVWFLSRQLRQAREECCDALTTEVCPDRLAYAQALAAVAESRFLTSMEVPAPGAARSPLVVRVRRLLGLDVPPEPFLTSRNAGWGLALALVTALSAAILHSGKLMAQSDEEQDPSIPVLVRPAPRGNVVDASGQPVSGARVRLVQIRSAWNPDNGVVDETTTDAAGHFILAKTIRFHHPDAYRSNAEYTLLADTPGLAPAWTALSSDGAPDAERRLTLTSPTHQAFIVTDRAGKPLPGAVVEMRGIYPRKEDGSPLSHESLFLPENIGLRRAVTDEAGRTTVDGLPDTPIQFVTSKEGFGDNYAFVTKLAGAPQSIPLQVASTLEGRVTDPLGRPVQGATVSLYPKFRFHTYFVAKTDAEGRYRVTKIWSDRAANSNKDWGRYNVSVRHPNFTAAKREVAFDGRQAIKDFDLAAVPGTEIVGHLLDPQTRAPVVDALVELDSPSGRQSFLTGVDGSFHGRVMPGEIYAFFSQPPRGSFVVDDRSGGLPDHLRIQASGEKLPVVLYTPSAVGRLGTVRGTACLAGGQPAVRCQVTASMLSRLNLPGWGGNSLRDVATDSAGKFIINDFPIGEDFTLDLSAEDGGATGTLPVRLEGDALDLPEPIVLQPTRPGGEFLLTDRHGQPRANLTVSAGVLRDGQRYPVQVNRLQSDASGVLRVPHLVPGASYAVTRVGPTDQVTRVVNGFVAPAADAPPAPRQTLVIDPEGVLRLLGTDGQPIPIKRVVDYVADSVLDGKPSRWSNSLPVKAREGADAVIPWDNLVGLRDSLARFLIETDDGGHVRAEGPCPVDGSNLYVIRATDVMSPDVAPDPEAVEVAANLIAGRVVTPEGEPIAGATVEMPGVHYRQEKVPPVLSGGDGTFRIPKPPYRFSYLTVAKEGWATAILPDVPTGRGFRVTLRNDTRLKGSVGGGNPGLVALLLKKNKLTTGDDSLDHEIRDVELRAATDEGGTYDLPVEPGRYRWRASSADGRYATGEINLEAGKTADLGAALQRGNDVVFQLVDCQSGSPVPGIEVSAYEQQTDRSYSPRENGTHVSDAEGIIRWENLPPGEMQFVALPHFTSEHPQSPYSRWWRADEPQDRRRIDYARKAPTGDDGTRWVYVDVQPGLPTIHILVERGVKITGEVVTADGQGVPYASIQAVAQQWGPLNNFGAQTDQAGRFSAYLPASNGLAYHLCAYTFPGLEKPAPGATAVSEWFQSSPGDERTFRLVMGKGGWFTGRLVTAEGQAASGFKVTAVASDDLEVIFAAKIAAAGPDGRFRLGPLRPGKYKIHPGSNSGAPLRKLPGASEVEIDIAEGGTRDLGDIILPLDAQRQE